MDRPSNKITRRSFLTCLGSGGMAMAAASAGLVTLAGEAAAGDKGSELFELNTGRISAPFSPVTPAGKDELVMPGGFRYDVVAAYGDRINKKGDTFGFNACSPCYFPVNGSSVHGLVWVSHKSGSSLWVEGGKQSGHYTPDQVKKLLYSQGGSVLEVFRDKNGAWRMNSDSAYARRVTGLDRFELTGPVKGSRAASGAVVVQGALASSSGVKTLWDTVLSCENHVEDTCRDAGLDAAHYGWIIEIDPFDSGAKLRKHTALGRLNHGNAVMGLCKNGCVAVYSGDDTAGGCIYKYISREKFAPQAGKANSALLADGSLYAADLENGKWIPLTIDSVKKRLRDYQFRLPDALVQTREVLLGMFNEPSDILVHARQAAFILGATPNDRPANIIINPSDNSLFIALTGNCSTGNLHGHVLRFVEKDSDFGAAEFEFEIFTAGGRQSGFSSPKRLALDRDGYLWIMSGVQAGRIGKGAWTQFKNNGIYLTGKTYPASCKALQFASGPVEAELAGLGFTPDEGAFFLGVQHPGEQTQVMNRPTSRWPHRPGDTMPRPALVAVTGV